jgi:hypothetical protein
MLYTIMCVTGIIVGLLLVILSLALAPSRSGQSRRQGATSTDRGLMAFGAVVTAVGIAGLIAQLVLGWK